jgi:aryl-alcohol dehydrogenase-like predicted oxidoreductase
MVFSADKEPGLMQYRTLGRTDLKVSFVGLGTGGPSRLGQKTHGDRDQSQRVVHEALGKGINLFDTAAAYSDSEVILGEALKEIPRGDYLLATKFSPQNGVRQEIISPGELVEACEKSLRRLGVETIDIYQFHGLVPDNYRTAVDKLFPTMEQLRSAGKIRFIGVTEYFFEDPGHEMLTMALDDDVWDTIMVKYGILNMSAADHVLPTAAEGNVGVLNMSPVRVKMTRPTELMKIIERWKQRGWIEESALSSKGPLDFVLAEGVTSVVQAGYKFGADHGAISSVVLGTGNPIHLHENIDSILGPPLPSAVTAKLRAIFSTIIDSEGDTG